MLGLANGPSRATLTIQEDPSIEIQAQQDASSWMDCDVPESDGPHSRNERSLLHYTYPNLYATLGKSSSFLYLDSSLTPPMTIL